MKPLTRAVHAGVDQVAPPGLAPALHQSSVYYASSLDEAVALEDPASGVSSYSRTANPTTMRFESVMAEWEGGEAAVATPSGMAALTLTFLTLLGPNDRVAVSPHSYADTVAVLAELAERVGFALRVIDLSDPASHEELASWEATMVVVETPSNPMLRLVEVPRLSERLAGRGATIVVDSTMGTPVNQRPLEWGADLVIHSASKYLSGHFNAIAGVVIGSRDLTERLRHMRTLSGICADPHTSWLLLQGLQTLTVRLERQNQTAQRVATFLASHPEVDFVDYPGLPEAEGADIAARQMSGFGGVVTFGLRRGHSSLRPFLQSLSLCTIAVSLGGTKTLIEAPTLMSHVQGGPDNETLSVIPPNAVRLSVGLEDSEDIIDDLAAGLRAVNETTEPDKASAGEETTWPEETK